MPKKNIFKLDVVSVRLVKDTPLYSEVEIKTPEDAIRLMGETLCSMDRELVCVLNLNSAGQPINCNIVSMGALDSAMAHPREILKATFLSNAASIVLVHNHPSAKLTPSKYDVTLTDRMKKICDLIGIELIDHIIVGGDNQSYYSFRKMDMIKAPNLNFATTPKCINWDFPLLGEEGKKR